MVSSQWPWLWLNLVAWWWAEPTFLHCGVKLCDLDGQKVNALLQAAHPCWEAVGLTKQLAKDVLSMAACERKRRSITRRPVVVTAHMTLTRHLQVSSSSQNSLKPPNCRITAARVLLVTHSNSLATPSGRAPRHRKRGSMIRFTRGMSVGLFCKVLKEGGGGPLFF